ncbi:MAG: hypothetical protein HN353_07290 [Bdellovibrionales bacterium]|jgi:methyl-accepting chemotaxis protein|nr:hypothetical protein [Bdellovibrionales bacterium]MBT3526614.1 hypothetical protein [Bdellovibrionales bacterium]MBT7766728.1 hypothetical protein [Bdellovibrionales bacterium]
MELFKQVRNSRLKSKLAAGALSLLLIVLVLVGSGVYFAYKSSDTLDSIYNHRVLPLRELQIIQLSLALIPLKITYYLSDQVAGPGAANSITQYFKQVETSVNRLKNIAQEIGDDHKLEEVAKYLGREIVNLHRYVGKIRSHLLNSQRDIVAEMFEEEWPDLVVSLINPIDKYEVELDASVAKSYQQGILVSKQMVRVQIILGLVAFFLMSLILRLVIVKLLMPIKGIISNLGNSSSLVGSASNKMNEFSGEVAQGAISQAASLEGLTAALSEATAMIRHTSDAAREVKDISESGNTLASQGEEEMQRMLAEMGRISDSSKKIEAIIGVIDGIAFQTNLLALNAAVEAARAGEQGRGFAVVAEEVRNLSQRSTQSSKEITALIKDAVGRINQGSEIARQSGELMSNLLASVSKIRDLNVSICESSEDQKIGLEQISQRANMLDSVTQKSAQSAESSEQAAKNLTEQVERLKELASNLQQISS